MRKKGQFFLIAALIIIGVLIGLGTIYNSFSSKEEDTTVYDLSKEINFESSRVLDNGLYSSLSSDQIKSNIDNLTSYYQKQNLGNDIAIIYGNSQNATLILIENKGTGSIGIDTGGAPITVINPTANKKIIQTIPNPGGNINIKLNSTFNFPFILSQNQQFYIVVKKERENERTVAVS